MQARRARRARRAFQGEFHGSSLLSPSRGTKGEAGHQAAGCDGDEPQPYPRLGFQAEGPRRTPACLPYHRVELEFPVLEDSSSETIFSLGKFVMVSRLFPGGASEDVLEHAIGSVPGNRGPTNVLASPLEKRSARESTYFVWREQDAQSAATRPGSCRAQARSAPGNRQQRAIHFVSAVAAGGKTPPPMSLARRAERRHERPHKENRAASTKGRQCFARPAVAFGMDHWPLILSLLVRRITVGFQARVLRSES